LVVVNMGEHGPHLLEGEIPAHFVLDWGGIGLQSSREQEEGKLLEEHRLQNKWGCYLSKRLGEATGPVHGEGNTKTV